RYGRIGRFAYQIAQLAEQYLDAPTLKRQAAYAALLAGQPKNGLDLWKNVAIATQSPDDWKNVAAIAFRNHDDDICCYALRQYYVQSAISEEEVTWFIFISLIRKLSAYDWLVSIIQSKSSLNSVEMTALFEAGVYLIKIENRIGLAENYLAAG